jgi:hypothetical protein
MKRESLKPTVLPGPKDRLPKREYKAKKVERKLSSYLSLVLNCGSLLKENFGFEQNLSSKGKPYLEFLCRVGNDRGLATMIKTAKASRLYVTRYLSGQPLTSLDPMVQLTKDWLPKRLGSELLRITRQGSTVEKRWLLTVLYSTRALELEVSPDYESIIAPNRSEKLANILQEMKTHGHGF